MVLVGKPEGKRPLIRLRLRKEDNITMDSGIGMGCMDCMDLAQERDRCRCTEMQ